MNNRFVFFFRKMHGVEERKETFACLRLKRKSMKKCGADQNIGTIHPALMQWANFSDTLKVKS